MSEFSSAQLLDNSPRISVLGRVQARQIVCRGEMVVTLAGKVAKRTDERAVAGLCQVVSNVAAVGGLSPGVVGTGTLTLDRESSVRDEGLHDFVTGSRTSTTGDRIPKEGDGTGEGREEGEGQEEEGEEGEEENFDRRHDARSRD